MKALQTTRHGRESERDDRAIERLVALLAKAIADQFRQSADASAEESGRPGRTNEPKE